MGSSKLKRVFTRDREELRPVGICNVCSRIHESDRDEMLSRLPMTPVRTQKKQILGAI